MFGIGEILPTVAEIHAMELALGVGALGGLFVNPDIEISSRSGTIAGLLLLGFVFFLLNSNAAQPLINNEPWYMAITAALGFFGGAVVDVQVGNGQIFNRD